MWLVALAGNLSAVWILLANGFMQHPVGYVIKDGRAELESFIALITNKHGLLEIIHVIPASLLLASFFIMGISAFHLLKKQHLPVFERSFRIGLVIGLVTALFTASPGICTGSMCPKPSRPSWRPWNPTGKPRPGRPGVVRHPG